MRTPSSLRATLPSAAILLALAAGCSSSDGAPAAQSPVSSDAGADAVEESAAGDDAADVQVDDAPADSASDAPELDAPVDASPPAPTLTDIQFAALGALPSGEQLLFNDWNAMPNTLVSMKPDGTGDSPVFAAYRIWAFGVSRQADRIAFACGDPSQEAHYGITIGDAIQHTWLYDVSAQTAELVADGNINDECHAFGPNGANLYVCRRYDFTNQGEFKGWRLGRIDLATKAFEFLTPEVEYTYDLSPQPLADESSLIFGRIVITPPNKQAPSVQQLDLPSGSPVALRTDGGRPSLSPDGTRYVFQKSADANALYVSDLDGSNEVKLSDAAGTDPAWSPDGTKLAYLIWDGDVGCSHIDVVAADGSQSSSPTRLRDCSTTGEFISQLSWVVRP